MSLSNQKCMIQPSLINLHVNKYSQEFHHYPSADRLDGCVDIGNILNDLSNKVCVPNKTETSNLSVLNMVIGINEWKRLTKQISGECKCRFMGKNGIQISSGITINADVSAKSVMYVKMIMFVILLHIVVKMENI